jgi:hypothetical protein
MPETKSRKCSNDSNWSMSKLKFRLKLRLGLRLSSTLLLSLVMIALNLELVFRAHLGLLKRSLMLFQSLDHPQATNPHLRQPARDQ